MKNRITLNFLAAIALCACQQQPQGQDATAERRSTVFISASTEDFDTKSSFTWSDSAVKDLQIIVTDEDGTLVESIYSRTGSRVPFTGDVGRTYIFRAVANLGREITGKKLSDFLQSTASVDFNSIQSRGVPMANAEGVGHLMTAGSSSLDINVTRLLARVDFRLDRSMMRHADTNGGFRVKSLKIFNATSSFAPLSETGIKKDDGRNGGSFDYASASDLRTLNQGGTISLYAFENLQGELLKGNTDPWNKVPEKIDGEENCSYIELTASYTAQGLSGEDLTYRMYLGSNSTTNFDICRNTIYGLTFFPTEEEMDGHRGSWKISSGIWSDIRSLSFSPSAILVESGSSNSSTVMMAPETFEVTFSHTEWIERLGCSLSYDVDSHKLTIACESAPEQPVTDYIRATSWDGNLEDELQVTVAKAKNPVVDIYLKGQSSDEVFISDHSLFFKAGGSINIDKLGLTYVFRDGTEHMVNSLDDGMYKRTDLSLVELSDFMYFYFEGYHQETIKSSGNSIRSESCLLHLAYSDEEGSYEGDIKLSSIARLFSDFAVPTTLYVNVGGNTRVNIYASYKDDYQFIPSLMAFEYVVFDIEEQYNDIAYPRREGLYLYAHGESEGSCPATLRFKTPPDSEIGFPPSKSYGFNINIIVVGKGILELEPDYKEIRIGESYGLSAKLYPPEDEINFRCVNPKYESRNPDVATVDSDGTVTGIRPGTAFITATYQEWDSDNKQYMLTSTATVKVLENDVISYDVNIEPQSISLEEDENRQVTAWYRMFVNGELKEKTDITQHSEWNSSDEAVASAMLGIIRAAGAGHTTVTAIYEGLSGSVDVEVTARESGGGDEGGGGDEEPEPLISYELVTSPTSISLVEGENSQITAWYKKFVNGEFTEQTDITQQCQWNSSDPTIVTVTEGMISAIKAGNATVTAVFDGLSSIVDAEVTARESGGGDEGGGEGGGDEGGGDEGGGGDEEPEPLISYELVTSPTSISLVEGENSQITAWYKKFVNGEFTKQTDITQQCQWNSSDPTIVTVTEGMISAIKAGNATVTAVFDGLSSIVDAEVTARESGGGDEGGGEGGGDEGGGEEREPEIRISYELVIPEGAIMNIGASDFLTAFLLKHSFIEDVEVGAPEKIEVTDKCSWQSSNDDVADVDNRTGRICAHSAGTAIVTARYSDENTGTLVSNDCLVKVSDRSGLGVKIIWGNPGGDININIDF